MKEIIARNKAIYRKLGVELTNEQASGAELVRFGGKTGYLDGIKGEYATPQGYFVDETEAEEFDKLFPIKEKKVLPGQLF